MIRVVALDMLTVAIVAVLAIVLAAVVGLVSYRRGARSDRRYDTVLQRVDEHLEPVAETLQQAAARADEVRARGAGDHELAPTIERLLERIAAEGAPSYAFRQVARELLPELAETRRLPRAKQPPTRDELTGVRDRRGYEAELEREIGRASRSSRPLALVLFDLGDLAEARVRGGHAEVDRLLQDFAALLVRVTRVTDTVCRRRGDEFGVLLPETDATDARYVRRRVREETARTSFGRLGPVTFSSGIVEWRPSETVEAFDARARIAVGPSSVRTFDPRGDEGDDSLGTPRAR